MASSLTIKQVLAEAVGPFDAIASGALIAGQMQQLTVQIQRLQTIQEAATAVALSQAQTVRTVATTGSSSAQSGSSGSSASGTALSLLGAGLGLSPLISGILKFFGGGDSVSSVSPLVKFALPDAIDIQAGVSRTQGDRAFAVDSEQGGLPRPVAVAPQVTVQVNALDSRSFLDHSADIAHAVRQAMLESSVLADVVREA